MPTAHSARPTAPVSWRAVAARALPFWLLGLVLFGITALGLAQLRADAAMTRLDVQLRAAVAFGVQTIRRHVELAAADVGMLAADPCVRRYVESGDPVERSCAVGEFRALAGARQVYDRLRLIDRTGRERLRVDLVHGAAVEGPDAQVQDPSGHFFVVDVLDPLRQPGGGLYVSSMDPVQTPGRRPAATVPMLYVALPLETADGNRRGFVILNLPGRLLLQDFLAAAPAAPIRPLLLDETGDWLVGTEPAAGPDRSPALGNRYPEQYARRWSLVRDTAEGLLHDADGALAYRNLRLPEEGPDLAPHRPVWRVLMDVPVTALPGSGPVAAPDLYALVLLVFVVYAAFVWRLACAAARRRAQAVWLGQSREALGERVRVQTEQLRLLRQAVEQSPVSVLLAERTGSVRYANPAARRLCGLGSEERPDGTLVQLLGLAATPGGQDAALAVALAAGQPWRGEICRQRPPAVPVWHALNLAPIEDGRGCVAHFVCLVEDITVRKQLELELLRLAHHDPLTGAANRRRFTEAAHEAIAYARRYHAPLALLLIDADRFKLINDVWGHDIGDRVLQHLAASCQALLRENDLLCRLGGEEFALLLPGIDQSGAHAAAERLRTAIAATPLAIGPDTIAIQVSIGATAFDAAVDTDIADLLRRADRALYAAKAAGRNRVIVLAAAAADGAKLG